MNNYKKSILLFLFPLQPIKCFRSIIIICILGLLIALAIILNLFSISIPSMGISISFAWLPTMLIGWFFGPVIGISLGFIIDSLNALIYGQVWFWLYAIQEPCIGLISGIISSLCRFTFNKKIKKYVNIIINQVFVFIFISCSIFILFYYTNPNNPVFIKLVQSNQLTYKINTIFRYVILAFLILFLFITEILIFYHYKKNKKNNINNQYLNIFLFSSIVIILSTLIFSFILGPISAIKYYEYLYNRTPPNLLKYGAVYYLLPRIIKECIKTPIYIVLFTLIIYSINPMVNNVRNLAINTYRYDN